MALIPRAQQSAMLGRSPDTRPQRSGISPQLAHGHAPTTMPQPPADPGAGVGPTPMPSAGTVAGAKAAMARAQSNPTMPKAAAMTAGPRVPAASPKRSPSVAGSPVSTLGNAAAGMPARMMKKGGLVRKGNVSHGKYTKKC